MAFRMKATSGGSFEQPTPGSCLAVCIRAIDWGTQDWGQFGPKRRLQIVWEIDQKMESGAPYIVSKMYTMSLNVKARLRQDLEGWRGKKFHDDEEFAISNVLGKGCMLNLTENDKGRVEVASVSPLPRGMKAAPPVNELICFDLDEPDWNAFNALAESTKSKIEATDEFRRIGQPDPTGDRRQSATNVMANPGADNADEPFDDDIPF